ncbi:ABC transporter substrate-binding protein [Methanococcoides methylutens]|uniref:ABC transporter substrate-binding protein n=1 Tax=Methanococcoides methylutens TaxID=2226 RepID=A0A099T4F0_METMT|nr:ABC transporter permease [Methanococcoides methylutens]KGK99724.1 ABC transporter substrate-binding protein [Methanococcoides methylutens]
MRYKTYLKLAANILFHSKIRSWLTIIGIVIGVGSVVTILAISDSMEEDMESRFADMDMTSLTITPGYTKASSAMGMRPGDSGGGSSADDAELTDKDVMALKLVGNVDYLYGQISGKEDVYYLGESADLSITGVDSQVWQYTTSYTAASGRLLEASDNYVAVIGDRIANDMFDQPISLNQVISINGQSVRVVGILESGDNDNGIIMPIDAAVEIIEDAEDDVFDSIIVKVDDIDNVDTVREDVEEKLMISRHVTESDRDFSVSDPEAQLESATEMMDSMSLFLAAIAGVSLVVGSVGIANTMFTSVMERTRDIGTMKAIGAKNRDILMIFLFNSAMVGVVGGVLGILLSLVLTSMLPSLGLSIMRSSMGSTLSPELIAIGISIAICVGIISGVVPAYNASKMKPVDALRYE